ncbi:MAG: 4-hydroxy-tetrahydrodipicolinate synthase [Candidatus Methylacidiphilales bacterium]|nr:4-hydroxy-tetrahydrodipicolinate synthase [Candidatus Methylacidiphilales bacterium]
MTASDSSTPATTASPLFYGTYTALVTPFRNDEVDEKALLDLIERQIAGGVEGVIPVGTTGESPTLSQEEHLRVIDLTIKAAKGRVKVIAGTGSNSTREAIEYTQEAEAMGADGTLLVAPYYNKPSQAGLIAHFGAIAEATRLPIILYSIPGRCGIEIGVDTTATLAANHSTIVGIKEAGGTVDRVSQLRQALPESFLIFSGDDSLTLPFMSVGAVGVISVASNLAPAEVSALVNAARSGNFAEAERLHRRLYPLFRDLFIEPNPVPVKTAMARRDWMTDDVRLPLVGMQPKNRERLEIVLSALDL